MHLWQVPLLTSSSGSTSHHLGPRQVSNIFSLSLSLLSHSALRLVWEGHAPTLIVLRSEHDFRISALPQTFLGPPHPHPLSSVLSLFQSYPSSIEHRVRNTESRPQRGPSSPPPIQPSLWCQGLGPAPRVTATINSTCTHLQVLVTF